MGVGWSVWVYKDDFDAIATGRTWEKQVQRADFRPVQPSQLKSITTHSRNKEHEIRTMEKRTYSPYSEMILTPALARRSPAGRLSGPPP